MKRHIIDCVVVGAGPAGLAASSALTAVGIDHLVLERVQPGQTWRDQRWDSLRLNNPAAMNQMLGPQPPQTYLTAAQVVHRLTALARSAPLRPDTTVRRLTPTNGRYQLDTDSGPLLARTVIVASGGENVPVTPALATALPARVTQLHAADYRNPDQLPAGTVLVVGSAQSGSQITEDLLGAGRSVLLASSRVGRAPARHRGRDTVAWLLDCGFFQQPRDELPDPSITTAPQPLLAPGGRTISLQSLARAGATLTGRLIGVNGHQLTFDDSLHSNLAYADAFADRIRAMLDHQLPGSNIASPSEAVPEEYKITTNTPTDIDLRAAGIISIIWSTGYRGDFSWLPPTLLNSDHQPIHRNGAAPVPGLRHIGLRWLSHRASGNFLGFPADATATAASIADHLTQDHH
jgi:putative flavoprotein involved in K+ transport